MTEILEERLRQEGLLPAEARRKREMFGMVDAAFRALGARPSKPLRWFVPGRIEVLGKHTDYAGGRSLLCAIGRGFCVTAAPRSDRTVRIADAGRKLMGEVALDPRRTPSASGWTIYAQTVAGRIARDFPGELRGADIALASDLPRASGLSSSSALVVALFSALAEVNGLSARREYRACIKTREDLAGYLGCLENGRRFGPFAGDFGVGTFGGSEDQTAILCCRAGELAQYAFCPVRHERSIRFPEGWDFVVASSGVASDKTGNARDRYNRLSLAAEAILERWNQSAGRKDASLYAAATRAADRPDRIRRLLRLVPVPEFPPDFLVGRLDQLLEESTVTIPSVTERLAKGDVRAVGELVDASQAAAERLLENQTAETVALQRTARRLGAAAASSFGGGFGGSVWALVKSEDAEAFRRRWGEAYTSEFPDSAAQSRFFITRPGPARLAL